MKARILLAALLWLANGWSVELHPPAEASLARVRRIYVDQLGGGVVSDQMRDMIIAALQNSGLFTITENPDRADAVLKGSADEKVFNEEHHTSDSIGVHASEHSGSSSHVTFGAGSSSEQGVSAGVTQNESSQIRERKHEAAASVRLVSADGDVIWSTTQESNGAKFRGALADVADRVARRLAEETKKARAAAEREAASGDKKR